MKVAILSVVFAFLGAVSFFAPSVVRADQDEVVCAAVFPCKADGTVPAPYNQGACAAAYEDMCRPYAHCAEICKSQCINQTERLVQRNQKLRRQLRLVKQRLLRASR
ncbi:MAG: hypothetical protein GX589_07375 [Deltaproteobacteria bacterium]|nr:hypothetical protein [Deltaproteobacteria bacterium]